jgi:hypothetical protein
MVETVFARHWGDWFLARTLFCTRRFRSSLCRCPAAYWISPFCQGGTREREPLFGSPAIEPGRSGGHTCTIYGNRAIGAVSSSRPDIRAKRQDDWLAFWYDASKSTNLEFAPPNKNTYAALNAFDWPHPPCQPTSAGASPYSGTNRSVSLAKFRRCESSRLFLEDPCRISSCARIASDAHSKMQQSSPNDRCWD